MTGAKTDTVNWCIWCQIYKASGKEACLEEHMVFAETVVLLELGEQKVSAALAQEQVLQWVRVKVFRG